jgi:hypothetical protein
MESLSSAAPRPRELCDEPHGQHVAHGCESPYGEDGILVISISSTNKVRVLGPMMVPSALPVIVTARHLCVRLGVVSETSINFLVPRFVSVFVTVSLPTLFQR